MNPYSSWSRSDRAASPLALPPRKTWSRSQYNLSPLLTQTSGHFFLDPFQVFNADRQPDQSITDALSPSFRRADVPVRGGGRVAARRGHVSQRWTKRDARSEVQKPIDSLPPAFQLKTKHVAHAARQQPLGQLVIGMVGPPRIHHRTDTALLRQPVRQRGSVR